MIAIVLAICAVLLAIIARLSWSGRHMRWPILLSAIFVALAASYAGIIGGIEFGKQLSIVDASRRLSIAINEVEQVSADSAKAKLILARYQQSLAAGLYDEQRFEVLMDEVRQLRGLKTDGESTR